MEFGRKGLHTNKPQSTINDSLVLELDPPIEAI